LLRRAVDGARVDVLRVDVLPENRTNQVGLVRMMFAQSYK